jgi:flagellar protein FliO/FliZ
MRRATWLAALAMPGPVLAAEAVSPPGTLSTVLQVLLGLGIVMAAIGGAAWLARRYVPGAGHGHGPVKVVGAVMVGPKERVVVIEVEGEWVVLGVTATQVNALHTLARPERAAPDASLDAATPRFPPPGSALARWLNARRDPSA